MLFNWDVSGIPKSFWGQLFEVFATGICVSAVQNMVPELLRIDPILSVCVSVCATFCRSVFGPILNRIHS